MSGALLRFRVMAYIVGVVLILLTIGMVLKYGFGNPHLVETVGTMHGFLYVVYLVTVLDLSFRVKYSVGRMILVMLAGTIPFLSFVAEHYVAKDVKARIAAEQVPTQAHGSAQPSESNAG